MRRVMIMSSALLFLLLTLATAHASDDWFGKVQWHDSLDRIKEIHKGHRLRWRVGGEEMELVTFDLGGSGFHDTCAYFVKKTDGVVAYTYTGHNKKTVKKLLTGIREKYGEPKQAKPIQPADGLVDTYASGDTVIQVRPNEMKGSFWCTMIDVFEASYFETGGW